MASCGAFSVGMVTPNSSSIAMISSTLSKPMTIQAGEQLLGGILAAR
jgi:hypothetical protein